VSLYLPLSSPVQSFAADTFSAVDAQEVRAKYRIFGHPRLLMHRLSGARVEIGLATMAYHLKRITNVLGATKLTEALHHA
jgi:hypothetical protein